MKKSIKKDYSFFFITPALIWQVSFFFASLFFILQLAFFADFFRNFTLDFIMNVARPAHFFVIFRSLRLATVTAFTCLLVGYPVAYFIALHAGHKLKSFFLFLVMLPFLTNLLVQIYAWYFILEKNGILNKFLSIFISNPTGWLNSSFSMYLVMFHIYLPFMIIPIYTILEKINVRLIEASMDLGGSYSQTFFKIILPLSYQGIKTGFFLVYVTSFGEYVIPALLGGQKYFYVGTLISEYFFIGRDWHTGAAFTCLSSFIFLLSVLFFDSFLRKAVSFLQGTK